MIEIKKTNNIKHLKNDWQRLYKENPNLVNNASYEYVCEFVSGFKQKLKIFLKPNTKPVYYYFVENGKVRMILPITNKDNQLHTLYTLDYFDIPADAQLTGEEILTYLQLLANQEKKEVFVDRLNQKYNTYKKVDGLTQFIPHTPCVEINFNDNYDEYFASLSKHTRQNLRTAYNRAKTDNFSIEFHTYYGPLDKTLAKKLQKIYLNRRVGRYKMNPIKKLLFSFSDPIKNVCFCRDDSFTSVVSFDGKPVAFMGGNIKKNEIMIPRLAIDEKYSRYSTGMILVNETVKYMTQNNYNCLDLTNGTEDYKYYMGGGDTTTYTIYCGVNYEKNKTDL